MLTDKEIMELAATKIEYKLPVNKEGDEYVMRPGQANPPFWKKYQQRLKDFTLGFKSAASLTPPTEEGTYWREVPVGDRLPEQHTWYNCIFAPTENNSNTVGEAFFDSRYKSFNPHPQSFRKVKSWLEPVKTSPNKERERTAAALAWNAAVKYEETWQEHGSDTFLMGVPDKTEYLKAMFGEPGE